MNILIRDAVAGDSSLIAEAIVMAIGEDMAIKYCGNDYPLVMDEIIKTDDTQFCYHNALVAEVDNIPAGAIIGYDGGKLKQLRANTFSIINKYHPHLMVSESETGDGEFYLDSIGVLPEFRGHGVGHKLLIAMLDKAFSLGHEFVGLSVDVDNPNAEKLYKSIGFRCVGVQVFLNHKLRHLQIFILGQSPSTRFNPRQTRKPLIPHSAVPVIPTRHNHRRNIGRFLTRRNNSEPKKGDNHGNQLENDTVGHHSHHSDTGNLPHPEA